MKLRISVTEVGLVQPLTTSTLDEFTLIFSLDTTCLKNTSKLNSKIHTSRTLHTTSQNSSTILELELKIVHHNSVISKFHYWYMGICAKSFHVNV